MSPDELVVTIAATLVGPCAWVWWAIRMSRTRRLPRGGGLGVLTTTVAVCAAIILTVLVAGAAEDVLGAYLFMYVVLGLAWVRAAESLFTYLGVSARDDAIERRNGAALAAISGALVGGTLAYSGGNFGNGPGWWVVLFSAAIATLGLAVTWAAHERLTKSSEVIVIDRDLSAGVRLGAFLAANGLLFGRAVAGDWKSAAATVRDAVVALPAAIGLLTLAYVVERAARPTADRPEAPLGSFGVTVAIAYVGLALLFVVSLGWPS